ncbi:MAG: flagellar filament capping protein FliD [Myxococcota bacterium]
MTTPLTSFSGLATGLDTEAIVSSLVAVESLPIRRLEQQQADNSSIRFRLDTIRGRLDSLKSALEGLDTRSEVLATGTTSSDDSVLTVSATGGASLGTYDVSVANLATAERTYSNTFGDIDGTGLFGTGTLTLQVGSGDPVDVTVDGSTSLNNLATAINDADAGVSAAVIFDGTNYRLQVAGEATGLENAITFTESGGLSLGLDDPANEVVPADDARFTIDTLTMTRPTNQVVSAIPGVSLDLQNTGSATVRVDRDPQALLGKVQDFVDAYNATTNGINAEFVFTGAARTGDSLNGDSTLRGLQSQLAFDAVQPFSGIAAGDFSTLAELGISTTQTGALELDESVFTSALESNPEALVTLFTGDEDAGIDGIVARFTRNVDLYTDVDTGLLTTRIDALEEENRDIDDRIRSKQDRVDQFETNLRRQYVNLETTVAGLQAQGDQLLSILSGLSAG